MELAKNAYPKTGGVVGEHVDVEGYIKSGAGYDVVSGRDIWTKNNIWENGQRVYSPNNKPNPEEIGAQPAGNYQPARDYLQPATYHAAIS